MITLLKQIDGPKHYLSYYDQDLLGKFLKSLKEIKQSPGMVDYATHTHKHFFYVYYNPFWKTRFMLVQKDTGIVLKVCYYKFTGEMGQKQW